MSETPSFTPITPALVGRAATLLDLCRSHGLTVITAESCTGGLVCALLTDIAGSSRVVQGGFVTYSNEAKHSFIGVPETLIETHGAVSEEVARAMAQGALVHSDADLAVAITGIAGPGGGSAEKPVGLVHFAAQRNGHGTTHRVERFGEIGRGPIRAESVRVALEMLDELARI